MILISYATSYQIMLCYSILNDITNRDSKSADEAIGRQLAQSPKLMVPALGSCCLMCFRTRRSSASLCRRHAYGSYDLQSPGCPVRRVRAVRVVRLSAMSAQSALSACPSVRLSICPPVRRGGRVTMCGSYWRLEVLRLSASPARRQGERHLALLKTREALRLGR